MPFADDEIEITFYKSSGPGGQHRNVTESAVRVRHLPTGIVVVSAESRSQHRNKEAALLELERRLELRNRRRRPRVPTRPSLTSRVKRVEEKRQRSNIKRMRKSPGDEG
ncbi:MAG: peptide chain release factor-like protein [FCB group bacterium]|nr:peptide chain release factor-like protein [FCB group bacterium]